MDFFGVFEGVIVDNPTSMKPPKYQPMILSGSSLAPLIQRAVSAKLSKKKYFTKFFVRMSFNPNPVADI
jgi:hypothetical protein